MGSNTVATMDGDSKLSTIFSKYLNSSDSDISKFVQSIPSKFDEAIEALDKSPVPMKDEFVGLNRELLKKVTTSFHTKAGTLDEKIRNQIDLLSDEKLKIFVGIHQPNLFAFSGVFKKIVLLESLIGNLISRIPVEFLILGSFATCIHLSSMKSWSIIKNRGIIL